MEWGGVRDADYKNKKFRWKNSKHATDQWFKAKQWWSSNRDLHLQKGPCCTSFVPLRLLDFKRHALAAATTFVHWHTQQEGWNVALSELMLRLCCSVRDSVIHWMECVCKIFLQCVYFSLSSIICIVLVWVICKIKFWPISPPTYEATCVSKVKTAGDRSSLDWQWRAWVLLWGVVFTCPPAKITGDPEGLGR